MPTGKTCPVCGSSAIETRTERREIAAPLGPVVGYDATLDSCEECGEVGDFDVTNDRKIQKALQESETALVRAALDELAAAGISNAYFERAFRLPQRTTARWKTGGASASATALLRLVGTFPWLVEVADAGFAKPTAAFTLLREAGRCIAGVVASQIPAGAGPTAVTLGFQLQFVAHVESVRPVAAIHKEVHLAGVGATRTTAGTNP